VRDLVRKKKEGKVTKRYGLSEGGRCWAFGGGLAHVERERHCPWWLLGPGWSKAGWAEFQPPIHFLFYLIFFFFSVILLFSFLLFSFVSFPFLFSFLKYKIYFVTEKK
jgi:hypothetical protein